MENPETQSLIVKLAIYAGGVGIGLAAKLAMIREDRKLTVWEIAAHSLTAFACAWIVWNVMNHYNAQDWAKNGVSVIVGRYGDYILLAIWKAFKSTINSKNKDII